MKAPAKKTIAPDLPTLPFATPRAFADWLSKNHATSRGLWIQLAKKTSGIASITYPEALEAALCCGWIDGQSRRIDETWYVQKFTPRGRRSMWSKINCAK
ncbi:MAG: YdeI/OmpD-associated family protein, partial [Vicinamibacteria bacterium]